MVLLVSSNSAAPDAMIARQQPISKGAVLKTGSCSAFTLALLTAAWWKQQYFTHSRSCSVNSRVFLVLIRLQHCCGCSTRGSGCSLPSCHAGGFSKIKRKLLEQLSDAAYNSIQSFHSDSAVSFAVFLNQLPDLVHQQPPSVLVNAMQVRVTTCRQQQLMARLQESCWRLASST